MNEKDKEGCGCPDTGGTHTGSGTQKQSQGSQQKRWEGGQSNPLRDDDQDKNQQQGGQQTGQQKQSQRNPGSSQSQGSRGQGSQTGKDMSGAE